MLTYIIIVSLLTLLHAYFDYDLIRQDIPITKDMHRDRLILYSIICALFFLFLNVQHITLSAIFWSVGTVLVTRSALYDYLLNVLRGKSLWYDSATTPSTTDQIIRFNKNWVRIPFLIIYIILIVKYLL